MNDYSIKDHIAYSMGFRDGRESQENYINALEAALKDVSKHIWRGDWNNLSPETRAILDAMKESNHD